MLVRNEGTISTAQAIDAAPQPEAFRFEIERMPFTFFVASELDVKCSPGIYPRISEPDKLDVFEIEQAFAIGERVE
jgi:hypothetical protein